MMALAAPLLRLNALKAALKLVHLKVGKLTKGLPGKFGMPQRGNSM